MGSVLGIMTPWMSSSSVVNRGCESECLKGRSCSSAVKMGKLECQEIGESLVGVNLGFGTGVEQE